MTGTAAEIIRWLTTQKADILFEVKRHRKKRSLNANDYYWKLVTEIANAQRMSKSETHNRMLRAYGQPEGIGGRLVTVYIPDTDEAERQALKAETYHIKPTSYVKIGTKDQTFRQYVLLRGSSTYDTKEMSILLEGTIQEAEQLGIQTLTPEEMARYGQHH